MRKSKSKAAPRSRSLQELVDFFDAHDMGDDWGRMPPVRFDVNIKRRKYLVPIDRTLMMKLAEIAKSRKTSSQRLINRWLRDGLRKATETPGVQRRAS